MRRHTTLAVGQSTMQPTETQPLEALSGEALENLHIIGILLLTFVARVYHMKPTGFEVISEQDCKELHYMYADEKKK